MTKEQNQAKLLAERIAKIADDKKGNDIVLLNMQGLSFVTDYFVIVSADNKILVKAIADYIEDGLAKDNVFPVHKEGYSDGNWVLMDFGDVVVHIFLEQERDFYNLEQLWADAPSEQIGTNDGE
jgi:ribosome-associated protein